MFILQNNIYSMYLVIATARWHRDRHRPSHRTYYRNLLYRQFIRRRFCNAVPELAVCEHTLVPLAVTVWQNLRRPSSPWKRFLFSDKKNLIQYYFQLLSIYTQIYLLP